MVSCDHQRTTQPHHIKDSLAYDIESIKIIPSNDILELKSYHITSPFSCQNIDGIIAYNYRLHSLDFEDLYNHKEISSIPLQREGPDGIPGRVAGIFPLSKDSIWVYDGIYMYLLNSAGRVNEKITLEDRESLIINTNYAMNTAKFSYNPKRHSLLYLTRKDDFIVEEYDIKKRKIIKTYPLSYSIINPKGSLLYADMDAPNVNFVDNKIIYNYPYESTIYLLDMDSGKQLLIDAPSCYTSNKAQTCNANGYSIWERHRIENVHFYDIMYLPECKTYIRLHIGGIDFSEKESVQTLLDSRPIYMMAFDKDFNIMGESKLAGKRYSCFTGWCALKNSVLLFNENSLSDSISYETLNVDIISSIRGL